MYPKMIKHPNPLATAIRQSMKGAGALHIKLLPADLTDYQALLYEEYFENSLIIYGLVHTF